MQKWQLKSSLNLRYCGTQSQEETAATIAEKLTMGKKEDEDVVPPIEEDAQGRLGFINLLGDGFQDSTENMTERYLQMNPTVIIFRWKTNRMQAKTTSYRINCGREEVEVKVEESVIIPQVIYAKKDEYITTAYQSIKDKPQDIPDTEDPELDARVSEVSDMMDSALASSGDSEGSAALFDVNGSPSDTHCEATDLDFVLQGRDVDWYNEPDDSNSYTTSQEFMQDDKLKVGNEITNYEVQDLSINKLSSDATDLAIDKISRNQLEYSDSVKSDGRRAPDFIQLHGSPRWHKNMSAAKNSERKREASRTNRSRWH